MGILRGVFTRYNYSTEIPMLPSIYTQNLNTTAPCTCSQGGLHLTITSFARPAGPQQGLTRPLPSAFGGRTAQKLFPARTAKRFELLSLQTLPALASGYCHSRRGLVPDFNLTCCSGGTVIIKHRPGVRCCGHRGGLFCELFVATGRGGDRKENKEGPGR